jgi:hypothetical protein
MAFYKHIKLHVLLSHLKLSFSLNSLLVSAISAPFPWSPLKLYFMDLEWSWSGVKVTVYGVGLGMELKLKRSMELEWN